MRRPEARERPSHTKNRGEGTPGRKNVIGKSFEVRTEFGMLETERKAVKMDQSEEGEKRQTGARSCRPVLTTGSINFILNAHKSALIDFKQNGVTRTSLLIQLIFTEHFNSPGSKRHSGHRAWHMVDIQQMLVSSPFPVWAHIQ